MKKTIVLLLFLLGVMLFSCSKETPPDLPKIDFGQFWGNIGSVGYNIVNDKRTERIKTTYFDGKNCQFNIDEDFGPTNIQGVTFVFAQKLTVNLIDVLNATSSLAFETYGGTMNYAENWISLDDFEQVNDVKTAKFYATVKEKESVKAEIVSVKYRELRIPSLEVKIKGYLYNTQNMEDSVLIDCTFITQASR